jgi:hypothetical protein
MAPLAAPMPPPSYDPSPLLLPPLSPLSSEHSPWSAHGAPTPAMAALPWRALYKLIFLRLMITTDAYDLPLAIPTFNFIRNEL